MDAFRRLLVRGALDARPRDDRDHRARDRRCRGRDPAPVRLRVDRRQRAGADREDARRVPRRADGPLAHRGRRAGLLRAPGHRDAGRRRAARRRGQHRRRERARRAARGRRPRRRDRGRRVARAADARGAAPAARPGPRAGARRGRDDARRSWHRRSAPAVAWLVYEALLGAWGEDPGFLLLLVRTAITDDLRRRCHPRRRRLRCGSRSCGTIVGLVVDLLRRKGRA